MSKETEEKIDLKAMLKDSNEVLRSAYSIAARRGQETNWEAFAKRLENILDKQHLVVYPTHEGGPTKRALDFAICAPEYHASLDEAGDRFCRMCGQPLSH